MLRKWLRGRASPCQGESREFESRLPLHFMRMSYNGSTSAFQADSAGSIPAIRSIFKMGYRQVGKATDFDSVIRRFESCYPSHYDPLAQLVEHLTFNQGVPRSNRGWVTN